MADMLFEGFPVVRLALVRHFESCVAALKCPNLLPARI